MAKLTGKMLIDQLDRCAGAGTTWDKDEILFAPLRRAESSQDRKRRSPVWPCCLVARSEDCQVSCRSSWRTPRDRGINEVQVGSDCGESLIDVLRLGWCHGTHHHDNGLLGQGWTKCHSRTHSQGENGLTRTSSLISKKRRLDLSRVDDHQDQDLGIGRAFSNRLGTSATLTLEPSHRWRIGVESYYGYTCILQHWQIKLVRE